MQENFGAAIRSATVFAAIASAIALAGCAAGTAPENADPAENAEARACLPDPALLKPQPAPDCEFGPSHRSPLDAEQWSRLKLEFERNRYRNAEKAARETLRKPLAVKRCEVASVTHE